MLLDGIKPQAVQGPAATESELFKEMKTRIHRRLIDSIDLAKMDLMRNNEMVSQIRGVIENLIVGEGVPLNQMERDRLVLEIQHETFGLGPLEPLLADDQISDILVNDSSNVYIEKGGKLQKTEVCFRDNAHLMQIIERIVSKIGRRIDESSPYVDARLPDGSRVNAIIPPLALNGPVLSIRRFGLEPLVMRDLIKLQALDQRMAELLEAAVQTRLNILISGGTGTGKTTLLNVLSAFIPGGERLITIEDSAELNLKQEHVVRLETRPPNLEGRGEVTSRDLLKNALRMRPDRIIIGEVRGGEALDLLQAMNTGHDGSLSTVHANTTRDALSRMETMVLMAGLDLPERAIKEQMASALDLVVQLVRFSDGTRKVVKLSEITGMEGNTIVMHDIIVFLQKGIDRQGNVIGEFRATGVRPRFAERFKLYGFELPAIMFEN
ncbi:Flp pilus assembly ATPase TadA [Citrifermentans bemidjiense Bem]|uniref:Flp pilus assembly ATPase TadA n=1 Tax=Citrifermentans bemidjiense (strain ATCC BAA-1014 / DSM 16622 / JCM 12645 / Bem) TaxID=404380 RepID=B5EGL0_CITBB|nr:CpaF family protein [Citrifermentans bemidjiense]ACH38075.1 Flp pilus assembly ATPase TadA [Citrifermentans bemidjiense Bem]